MMPGMAYAQAAPHGDTPPDAPSQDVVVTGQAPAAQSSIDRKTYRVSSDLQSAGGSASDVLRNLPAVDVDAQGAVSLRGDTNVHILVDGKPSTMMTGANRADALEQFPANTIDHIEVITNPSAQFKADGAAGIINIVTRKDRKPGLSGSASASAGSDGRFNLAGKMTYHAGPLTATASLTLHRDMRRRPFSDRRNEIDPATGRATASAQDSLFHGEKLSRIVSGGVDYDLTSHDRLSLAGSYNHRTGTPQLTQHDLTTDPSDAVTSDFDRTGTGHENEVTDEATGKYRHVFAGKDRVFTLDFRRGETIENEIRRFTDVYRLPAGLVTIDQQRPRLDLLQREATAEYSQPLWGGKLRAGYDVQRDDDDFRNHGDLIDPATGAATTDPTHSYHFRYGQTVHAFYATYDRTIAKNLSAILGLRLEQTVISTDQIDLSLVGRQRYFRAYPTLHLQYDAGGGHSLKFSYGNRIVRPDPEDLNPSPVFSDPLNLRAGNPDLKPQETRAFEAAYQYEAQGLSIEATLFARLNRNGFTEVSRFISPTVLLTTKENLGRSSAFGIDLAANGKLSPVLSYRFNGTVSRNAIDAGNLGFAGARSIIGATAKGGIDLSLSHADLVQLGAIFNGKRLTPQGYRLASFTANLGLRHRFQGGLTAVLSLSDLLDSQRERSVIDSATIVERSTRRNSRRMVSLALSRPLGGARAPADTPFDFGN